MITPAYTITASERILPRLALDFTTGILDSRVSITRSLNTATRVNSSGLIETVNADLPRFDYNPVTQAPLGLLIEEQRINSLRYSEQFDNPLWVKAATSIAADDVVSPDGNKNADKIVENFATSPHAIYVTFTYGAGLTYAASVYAKKAERNWLYIGADTGTTNEIVFFDLNSGTVGNQGTGYVGSMVDAGNGWWRCVVIITQSTALPPNYLVIGVTTGNNTVSHAGNGTSGVYIWGAQLEAGAFATSYIPTTTTSLTRNADVVSMTGTNFSSWYNATEGTLSFEGSVFVDQGATTVDFIQISNGVSNAISIDLAMFGVAAPFFSVGNSGSQCNIDTGTLTLNTVFKMVGAYKADSFAAALNGGTPGTDPAGTIPTVSQMGIGNRLSGPYMNGHARKFAYWPQRLINAEVQAFSK